MAFMVRGVPKAALQGAISVLGAPSLVGKPLRIHGSLIGRHEQGLGLIDISRRRPGYWPEDELGSPPDYDYL